MAGCLRVAAGYIGKLVPKTEARGKTFNLFRCSPVAHDQYVESGKSFGIEGDKQAWIKVRVHIEPIVCRFRRRYASNAARAELIVACSVRLWQVKWKSITKVPEPRKIKIQLHGENQSTRMLRNFCAEKRCAAQRSLSLTAPRLSSLLSWRLCVVSGR